MTPPEPPTEAVSATPPGPAGHTTTPEAIMRRGPLFWISAAVGAVGIGWGLRGIFTHHIDTRPTNLAKFFVGGVVIHDAIFAPFVLGAGVALSRVVRGRARSYVQATLIIVGCLALFAYPEVRDYARVNHNPTSLPYNYTANLLAVGGAVVAAVVLAAVGHRFGRRASSRPAEVDEPVSR